MRVPGSLVNFLIATLAFSFLFFFSWLVEAVLTDFPLLSSIVSLYPRRPLCSFCSCGLRYARTKQKEEGHVPNRRRVIGASDIQSSPTTVAPQQSHSQESFQTQFSAVTTNSSNKKRGFTDDEDMDERRFSGNRRSSVSPSSSVSPGPGTSMIPGDSPYTYRGSNSLSTPHFPHNARDARGMAMMTD